MAQPFFTIGHATRTLDQFAELLMESRVGMVVDVRSMPRSRTNPQFNRDVLPVSLQDYQIGYRHLPALGGLRKKQMPEEESPNDYWRVKSFRRYADYALGSDFAEGLATLRSLGRRGVWGWASRPACGHHRASKLGISDVWFIEVPRARPDRTCCESGRVHGSLS